MSEMTGLPARPAGLQERRDVVVYCTYSLPRPPCMIDSFLLTNQ